MNRRLLTCLSAAASQAADANACGVNNRSQKTNSRSPSLRRRRRFRRRTTRELPFARISRTTNLCWPPCNRTASARTRRWNITHRKPWSRRTAAHRHYDYTPTTIDRTWSDEEWRKPSDCSLPANVLNICFHISNVSVPFPIITSPPGMWLSLRAGIKMS